MSQTGKKNLVITSIALYFTYFIHGIGASIMGQYKPELAAHWGAKALSDGTMDVSMVVSVIAALGLGRLISLPFSGPLSDKFGRRLSGIIGVICYAAYFMGIAFAPSMGVAYAFAIVGGIANSFLDTCVSPTCMEIYVNNPSVANLFTKFSMCISQFLLPFLIGFVAAANMSYRTIFIVAGAAIFIDGILILFLPFPERNTAGTVKKEKAKLKITPAALAAILIGFTSSSTFMLWLNCNQELGKLYNLSDPSKIQSFYAVGTFAAILCSSVFIKKGLKEIQYPDHLSADLFHHAGTLLLYPESDNLSYRWICDRFCRCRRCASAGCFHNCGVLPGKQGNCNIHGHDRIQRCELHHSDTGRLHYKDCRNQCSENDPASQYGSDIHRNPSCTVR